MNAINHVTINVVSSSLMRDKTSISFNPDVDGTVFSLSDEINVNKLKDAHVESLNDSYTESRYSVVYLDCEFKEIDISAFTSNFILLLLKNLSGTIEIDIKYHYINKDNEEFLDEECGIVIMKIDDILSQFPSDVKLNDEHHVLKYIRNKYIDDLEEKLTSIFADESDISDDSDDSSDDIDEGTLDNADENWFMNYFGYVPNSDDESEDADESDNELDITSPNALATLMKNIDKVSTKKKKSSYGKSRVFAESKNPKKEYKRHGVIIARDKKLIEKDEKILKNFLKDFIPGKQSWVKEFRAELIERWMKMYTIKQKSLKKLEKDQKRKKNEKNRKKKNKKILDFTRNMFTVPINNWDDPNK